MHRHLDCQRLEQLRQLNPDNAINDLVVCLRTRQLDAKSLGFCWKGMYTLYQKLQRRCLTERATI